MDWIIGLALLVAGGIIGFFVARHLYSLAAKQSVVSNTEQTRKEIMAQHAEHHLVTSQQAIDQIRRQCESLQQQLDAYQASLREDTEEQGDKVNFYGDQAAAYLRNPLSARKRKSSSADVQPKDFAGESSGLFIGKNPQQTAENE